MADSYLKRFSRTQSRYRAFFRENWPELKRSSNSDHATKLEPPQDAKIDSQGKDNVKTWENALVGGLDRIRVLKKPTCKCTQTVASTPPSKPSPAVVPRTVSSSSFSPSKTSDSGYGEPMDAIVSYIKSVKTAEIMTLNEGKDLFQLPPAEKPKVYDRPDFNRLDRYKWALNQELFENTLDRFYDPEELDPLPGKNHSTFGDCCTIGRPPPRPPGQVNKENANVRPFIFTIIYPGEFRPGFVDGSNFFKNYIDKDPPGAACNFAPCQYKRCGKRLRKRLLAVKRLFRVLSLHAEQIILICWIPLEEWRKTIEIGISKMKQAAVKNTIGKITWDVRYM